jgi:2,3,4,5-tetrahydropyridine-2-carboxylate N-succinyltransferase
MTDSVRASPIWGKSGKPHLIATATTGAYSSANLFSYSTELKEASHMSNAQLETAIEAAWDARDTITPATTGETREAIEDTLNALDSGTLRVAERRENGDWHVNQWAKKAVLLSFRLNDMAMIEGSNGGASWWDKVPSKWQGWGDNEWKAAGFRAVPGSIVRRSAYIAKNVVLMPSFVNIGAYVDEGSMVDGWATVGSCAQIGKNVHLSGGVGIGGVLEPMQAGPTIIEDNCFIGARSEVVEGCIIREGSVLGMGVFIGQSTKIVDRETGEVFYGEVPPYSVVVAGSMPSKNDVNLYCAVIVKRVDAKTRSKTGINELLRD